MFAEITGSLNGLLNKKGIRRTLWGVAILAIVTGLFESGTGWFTNYQLNRQAVLLKNISASTTSKEHVSEVYALNKQLLIDYSNTERVRKNPIIGVKHFFLRFVKGALAIFPFILFWLIRCKTVLFYSADKIGADRTTAFIVAWLGFSVLTWLGTFTGILSAYLNTSKSFFHSWILFPFGSLITLLIIAIWITLLRSVMPSSPVTSQHDHTNS